MIKPARLSGLMLLTFCLLAAFAMANDSWAAAARVSAAGNHTVALKTDGTLWGWGDNTFGQIGDGSQVSRNAPVKVGTDADWSTVVAGYYHSVALKADGSLWTWGDNTKGQLGDSLSSASRSVPVKIGTDTNWTAIAAGDFHTLALKTDGTLWAWGDNGSGQVGSGAVVPGIQAVPVKIGTGSDWSSIAAGGMHSMARKTSNTLWGWGSNSAGQLGNGTALDAVAPVQINLPAPFINTDWSAVAAGQSHSAALKADGSLWSWGSNASGRLGNGATLNSAIPVREAGNSTSWVAIAAGDSHTVGRKSDGTLWTWGGDANGQLGNGTNLDAPAPVKIGSDTDWINAVAGGGHSVALKANGTVWSWGDNSSGQLGDGTNSSKNVPAQIAFSLVTPLSLTVIPDSASPQAAGTPIAFNASASGGSGGPYEYQFWLKDMTGTYTLVQPYSAVTIWNWVSNGLPTGTYSVATQVRVVGTTPVNGFDAERIVNFVIAPATVQAMDVTVTPATPQLAGTPLTIAAANVSGGSGDYLYQFWLKDTTGIYTLSQGYSTANIRNLDTNGFLPGIYSMAVQVKSVGSISPNGYDLEKVVSFTILPPVVQSMDVTVTPSTPQLAGTPLAITATNVSGGSGDYLYQFWLKDTSGTYTLSQAYSTTNVRNLNTTGFLPGVYYMAVHVKSVGSISPAGFDLEKVVSFVIIPPPVATMDIQISAISPQPVGTPLTFTAINVSGGSGPYEYQFWLKDTTNVYSLKQPYSAAAFWDWDTTGLSQGTYYVAVQARSVGSISVNGFDQERVVPFSLGP